MFVGEDLMYTHSRWESAVHADGAAQALAQVSKTPRRPRSWANASLLQMCSHRNAWAILIPLGQPNTLSRAQVLGGALKEFIAGKPEPSAGGLVCHRRHRPSQTSLLTPNSLALPHRSGSTRAWRRRPMATPAAGGGAIQPPHILVVYLKPEIHRVDP
jgi:hypothetical protein